MFFQARLIHFAQSVAESLDRDINSDKYIRTQRLFIHYHIIIKLFKKQNVDCYI